jgi:hypothetical protein
MVTEPNDKMLEALFADARDGTDPSDDLKARVLADAASVQAGLAHAAQSRPVSGGSAGTVDGGGWFAGLVDAMGGWPAVSGVTLAGVTGLVLGFYAPDMIDTLSGGQIWSLSGEVGATPDIGTLWVEAGDV